MKRSTQHLQDMRDCKLKVETRACVEKQNRYFFLLLIEQTRIDFILCAPCVQLMFLIILLRCLML